MNQIDQDPSDHNEPVFLPGVVDGFWELIRGAVFFVPALICGLILIAGPLAFVCFSFLEAEHWLKDGEFLIYSLDMYAPAPSAGEYAGAQQIFDWIWGTWIGVPIAIVSSMLYFIAQAVLSAIPGRW
ncbi:hypothetical protein GCM10007989_07310 [Devosia pacifica]|uniref:Uncharacterized protein n=1 Tax=Devosia pacifica TaxID=1335967 RepID=A0A918RWD1_9HYPH|nr:hypothetical protein [Devosia pacifica]GHA15096.1 hypothetical protein GCM10007989_07310 [Devosia pacifica]